jgi:hypothetical protein
MHPFTCDHVVEIVRGSVFLAVELAEGGLQARGRGRDGPGESSLDGLDLVAAVVAGRGGHLVVEVMVVVMVIAIEVRKVNTRDKAEEKKRSSPIRDSNK